MGESEARKAAGVPATTGASTPAVGGIATFSTTILDTAGNYTFTATDTTTGDTGFTSTGASGTTTISPAGASKLVFSTAPPATGTAGTALTTLKVSVEDLYGNLMVLLKSVTDAAHLDMTPRMRLVDAVDAMADNRGELLFELRGSTQRQFALYRVLRGQVDKLFASGAGEIMAEASK